MGKGYAAAVLTATALDEQQRYFAVYINYTTPLRVTNYNTEITVASSTYYPWSVDVLEPPVQGGLAQNLTIVVSNGDLTGVSTLTGRLAELDIAQDSRGRIARVYECTVTATGRTDTLVFDGYVDEFSASDDSGTCRISCTPQETMGSRPGSNYCMSICRWRKFGGDDCQYEGVATTCTRTLADCRRKVGLAEQTVGSGLNDIEASGTHSGSQLTYFIVRIDGTGTPDTFEWTLNNWSSSTSGVAITGSTQLLAVGVYVKFTATTGHTLNDEFSFQASWEDYFGNLLHAPAAGTVIEINGYNVQVPQSTGGYYYMPIIQPPETGSGSTLQPPPPGSIDPSQAI